MVPMYIYHQFRIHAQYFLTFPKQQDTSSSSKIHNLAISLTIDYVFKTFLPVGHGKMAGYEKVWHNVEEVLQCKGLEE